MTNRYLLTASGPLSAVAPWLAQYPGSSVVPGYGTADAEGFHNMVVKVQGVPLEEASDMTKFALSLGIRVTSLQWVQDYGTGLTAAFSSDVVSGQRPLTVAFKDMSVSSDPNGVLGHIWFFGDDPDGKPGSNDPNPQHTYQEPGTYTVKLFVIDASNPMDVEVQENYITVT